MANRRKEIVPMAAGVALWAIAPWPLLTSCGSGGGGASGAMDAGPRDARASDGPDDTEGGSGACQPKTTSFPLPSPYAPLDAVTDGTTTWILAGAFPGVTVSYAVFTLGPDQKLSAPGLIVGQKTYNAPILARVGATTRAMWIATSGAGSSLKMATLSTAGTAIANETKTVVPSVPMTPPALLRSFAEGPGGSAVALLVVGGELVRLDVAADGTAPDGLRPAGSPLSDAGSATFDDTAGVAVAYAGTTLLTAWGEKSPKTLQLRIGGGSAPLAVSHPGASLLSRLVPWGPAGGFAAVIGDEGRVGKESLVLFDGAGKELQRFEQDANAAKLARVDDQLLFGWTTPPTGKGLVRGLSYCRASALAPTPSCDAEPAATLSAVPDLTLRGISRVANRWATITAESPSGHTLFFHELCLN